jgi:hypothetical protein
VQSQLHFQSNYRTDWQGGITLECDPERRRVVTNLVGDRLGYTARGFEFAVIAAVVAAVVAVAFLTRRIAEHGSATEAERLSPIRKLVGIAQGERFIAQCGIAELHQIDLGTARSEVLYTGKEHINWSASRDGKTLAVSDISKVFRVIVEGETVVEHISDYGEPLLCALSPDGMLAATVERSTQVRCWDFVAGNTIEFQLKSVANKIAIDSRHRQLVVINRHGIDFYDIAPNASGRQFVATGDAHVFVSDDGCWLVSLGGRSVTVYDIESNRIAWKHEFDGVGRSVAVDISADSRFIAIGRRDDKVTVREISTGRTSFECEAGDKILSIAFTANGDSVLMGQSDGSLVHQPLQPGAPSYSSFFLRADQRMRLR